MRWLQPRHTEPEFQNFPSGLWQRAQVRSPYCRLQLLAPLLRSSWSSIFILLESQIWVIEQLFTSVLMMKSLSGCHQIDVGDNNFYSFFWHMTAFIILLCWSKKVCFRIRFPKRLDLKKKKKENNNWKKTCLIRFSSMLRSSLSLWRTSRTVSLSGAWRKLRSIFKQLSVIICCRYWSSLSLCFDFFCLCLLLLRSVNLPFTGLSLRQPQKSSIKNETAETERDSKGYCSSCSRIFPLHLTLISIGSPFFTSEEVGALQRRVVPSTWTIKPRRLCPSLVEIPRCIIRFSVGGWRTGLLPDDADSASELYRKALCHDLLPFSRSQGPHPPLPPPVSQALFSPLRCPSLLPPFQGRAVMLHWWHNRLNASPCIIDGWLVSVFLFLLSFFPAPTLFKSWHIWMFDETSS